MVLTTAQIEGQLEQLTIVIKAGEAWAKTYSKDPPTHAALIKLQAKMERVMRDYLRGLKQRSVNYVNWQAYTQELLTQQQQQALKQIQKHSEVIKAAANVNINIFDPNSVDPEDQIFSQAIHDPILAGIVIGAQAGQNIYKTDLGLGPSSQAILEAAQKRVAQLVGKKVLKDGRVIDNPNPSMSITDTTRNQIQQSIATSLSLGETSDQATARMQKIVGDYNRAQTIAATESVNAYSQGMLTYGKKSGATEKEWYTAGAKDELCLGNESQGAIDVDDSFDSGDDGPPAHPNCNCGMRLIHGNGFDLGL